MALKDQQDALPSVRPPLLQVRVNSLILPTVFEAETEQTGHFGADTFSVSFARDGLPTALNPVFWADVANAEVEILGGYRNPDGSANYLQWIVGRIDDIDESLDGRTYHVRGRDMSGLMIDAKTAEVFADQTSSQIVQTIAARRGLTANVKPTTTKAGKIYQQFHAALTRNETEWDLLCRLAQYENFDLYVRGKTVYFLPPADPNSDPYVLTYSDDGIAPPSANAEHINFNRNLTLARDVVVVVRSWHQGQKRVFETTLKSPSVSKHGPMAPPQTYSYVVANLDQSQVNAYAAARMAEITRHERVLNGNLPGDNILSTRMMVKMTGTGTAHDQTYYPESVHRSTSSTQGYRMVLKAKNNSPRDVTTVSEG